MHNTAENSVIEINQKQKKAKNKFLVKLGLEAKWQAISSAYSSVKKKFDQQPKNIKYGIIGGSVTILLSLILVLGAYSSSAKVQDNSIATIEAGQQNYVASVKGLNPINEQLDDISAKLANLEKSLSGNAYIDLDSVRKSVTSLQTQVSDLSQHSNEILTKQIQSSTEQLQDQLSGIKKELVSLNEQKKHHQYIDPSKLPFKVVDIANIQQSDIVTISYANKIFPLYAGDAIAGWTLTQANSVNQAAEFKNKDENYIQISLNG